MPWLLLFDFISFTTPFSSLDYYILFIAMVFLVRIFYLKLNLISYHDLQVHIYVCMYQYMIPQFIRSKESKTN